MADENSVKKDLLRCSKIYDKQHEKWAINKEPGCEGCSYRWMGCCECCLMRDAFSIIESKNAEINRMKNLLSDDQPCPPPPNGDEEQRWISVSERLPEEDEEVLVLFGNSCSVMRITNADKQDVWHWDGSYNMAWSNFNDTIHADICEATHWMPLPEPPQEG